MDIVVESKPTATAPFLRDGVHLHVRTASEGASASIYQRLTPTDARQLAVQLCAHADAAEKAAEGAPRA